MKGLTSFAKEFELFNLPLNYLCIGMEVGGRKTTQDEENIFSLSRIFHRVATATRTLKALPISEAIMEELIISQIPLRINLNTPLNGTLSAILNFLLLCWKYPIQRRIVLSYLCIHISAKLVQGQWLIVPPCIKLRIIFGLWHARQKWKNVSARIWAIVLEMIFDRFYN